MKVANSDVQDATHGGARHMSIISESGLYKLIGNSNKPEACEFQNWIYQVVIPSIRQTHGYIDPVGQQMIAQDPAYMQQIIARNQELERRASLKQLYHVVDPESFLYQDYDMLNANRQYIDVGQSIYVNQVYITLDEFAKVFCTAQKHLGLREIGRNELFAILRFENYLMKTAYETSNILTQTCLNAGLMVYSYDTNSNSFVTKVSPAGIDFFMKKYLARM